MEGNEVGIFVKAPDWMPLLLLKIKIKQNPGYPSKEYNVILKHINQNIRAYRRSKKSALINDYENIIAYSKWGVCDANKCGLFQIYLGGLGISATKIWLFTLIVTVAGLFQKIL